MLAGALKPFFTLRPKYSLERRKTFDSAIEKFGSLKQRKGLSSDSALESSPDPKSPSNMSLPPHFDSVHIDSLSFDSEGESDFGLPGLSRPGTAFSTTERMRRATFDNRDGHQSHRVRAKEKFREAIDKMKKIKFPLILLQKKPKKEVVEAKAQPSMFSLALTVPFRGFGDVHADIKHETCPVFLGLIKVDIDEAAAVLGNEGFSINLRYGEMEWRVHKNLSEIFGLHSYLTIKHFQKKIQRLPKFPNQLEYAFSKAKTYIPSLNEILSRDFLLARLASRRRKAVQVYLTEVLSCCDGVYLQELYEFFELSAALTAGWKGKEGVLKQGSNRARLFGCLPKLRAGESVWTIVRDSYVASFENNTSSSPLQVLLLDPQSAIDENHLHSMNPLNKKKFRIILGGRYVQYRADSEKKMNEFLSDMSYVLNNSPWCHPQRFDSFAPVRQNIQANFYVDGHDYFEKAYEAINSARKVIFIQDWWLSPEVYLKRPPAQYPESRIDRLLQKKAEEGVKIYVIVYKEVSFSLTIDSASTKTKLMALHPNIKVMRYPDHVYGGVLYWALHDKILIIDTDLAFIGGLDLCFGRYDTNQHEIFDSLDRTDEIFPGQDYSNPREKDFKDVTDFDNCLIDKTKSARMPWHDVHASFTGQIARDASRHFVQRWNFIKELKAKDRDDLPLLLPPPELSRKQIRNLGFEGSSTVQLVRSSSFWSMGTPTECSIYNAYMHHIANAQEFIYIENQFFISGTNDSESLPYYVRNRIAQALCDRIIAAHRSGTEFRVFVVVPLFPAFENEVDDANAATLRLVVHWQQMTAWKGDHSLFSTLRKAGIEDPCEYISFCSLRNHGQLPCIGNETPAIVTEQIYIHSKVFICDDRVVIMGSANCNDRSMNGNRDAEIAAVIEDVNFAGRLRKTLFAEHLGLDPTDPVLDNPVSSKFYHEVWNRTAKNNTDIYRLVFRCVPDDTVTSWEEYEQFTEFPFKVKSGQVSANASPDFVRENLSRVVGHLVDYPTSFLAKENLGMVFPAKEALISTDVFV
jgi:phosphatidylserine/phosphatidylglycerophosphate/cardiolipin synthase-like enzyme